MPGELQAVKTDDHKIDLWSGNTIFMALLVFLLPDALLAATRTWDGGGADELASNPTNWDGNAALVANDAIVLNATSHKSMTWNMTNMTVASWTQVGYLGTVTVATVYGATGFTNLNITGNCVINNGMWTHVANPAVNYEANRLAVSIGGGMNLGAGAVIDVTGKGYTAGRGPGRPGDGSGSYGGIWIGASAPGKCYGSITAPTNLGSGGNGNTPGPGGGAIMLRVAGGVTNLGAIRADGTSGFTRPGSGGSVYLVAGSLSGAGGISANGGSNTTYFGGGGGRVALVVTNTIADFSTFNGTISAYGGVGAGYGSGCAGTIYKEKKADAGKGELIVNNLGGGAIGYAANNTDLSGMEAVTYEFSRITLTNNGNLNIGPDDVLIVTNTLLVGGGGANNGIWISGGTLLAPSVFIYSNMYVGISATGSTFNPITSLTVATNAEFRVDKQHSLGGNVTIGPGGKLTHTANPGSTESYKMILSVNGSLTIQAGGMIDVTGKGYSVGPGYPYPPGSAGGGSYGGWGWPETVPIGTCYGSIVAPVNLGSGGKGNGPSSGGGGIILRVAGGVTNAGFIQAEGGNNVNRPGSGGSINIESGSLNGDGVITANGGTGYGGGGGGRIALAVTNAGADFSSFVGSISAFGGNGSAGSAAAGTVYLRTAGQGIDMGALIIDNNNVTAAGALTVINLNVTDAVVGDVIIRNKGCLLVDTNQALTLSKAWSNAASFTANTESRIIFSGAAGSTSTVYGNNTFMGLVCTNTFGKTLVFQANSTSAIADNGRLILKGAPGTTNLFLRSSIGGMPWNLNVAESVDQSVMYVDVINSDALPGVGTPVIAINSRDRGGNLNWIFMNAVIGETNVWTGNSNTAWSLNSNWSLARPPIGDDFILIPSGCPRYPVLDLARTVNGIEIKSGASLDLAGYNLTVKKVATIAGVLRAVATEIITFQANVDFTGGSFTAINSTVLLAGSVPQAAILDGLAFNKINVVNTNTVSFDGGFSATELRCEAESSTRSLQFQQSSTVVLRDIVLQGVAGGTNIILRSSAPDHKWNLAVSGYRSVCGVDVKDSDASSGLPITAISSRNSGNNPNWLFNPAWSVWLGASGNNFHDPANWSPPGVPGSSSRVLVESANPMVISSPVYLLDLTVGGGAGQALVTANASVLVNEDIMVLTNGVLTLNRPSVVRNGFYVFSGGMLTHSANGATDVNKLDLSVRGNFAVDLGAVVGLTAKGYSAGNGPGALPGGSQGGASHGGVGSLTDGTVYGPCYGSILAPTNLGSGGGGSQNTAGGGAILMTVAGQVRIDGNVLAEGEYMAGGNRPGSGGSIFIRAGSLIGVGVMSVNGGSLYSGGGGGRIALVVTNAGADFSGYTGSLMAYGGGGYNAGPGGAGTIYRQFTHNRRSRGTVLVNNNNVVNSRYTDVPHNLTNEVDFIPFHITNAAILRLTNSFTLGDISLQSANTRLDLGSNILTVRSREHSLAPGVVTNYGSIIWWPYTPKGTIYFAK